MLGDKSVEGVCELKVIGPVCVEGYGSVIDQVKELYVVQILPTAEASSPIEVLMHIASEHLG